VLASVHLTDAILGGESSVWIRKTERAKKAPDGPIPAALNAVLPSHKGADLACFHLKKGESVPMRNLLLFVALTLSAVSAKAQTQFQTGPSSTANGTHEAGCPISIVEQDGQSYPPGAGAVCFNSGYSDGNWCTTPSGLAGPCISLYFPIPTLGTSGLFEGAVITSYDPNKFTYGTSVTTYCAPSTLVPGDCGVGSTFTQTLTFNFWDQYTGTLVLNFLRHNTYQPPCARWRCPPKAYNDVITSGSGSIQ